MEGHGPQQFGPYVVLEQIGSGGMGAVYRARDRRLERDVAIKVLHRHLEMAGARERFLREARAVSSLNHPNISTIFDIGEQDGDPYLVMELLHGESLKERLQDGGEIPQDELIAIATQAAQALAAAHAKGIVHRDIKPANLFLVIGPHGEPQLKILDFGLAKVEQDRILFGDSGLTRTGSTVGTVEYMSPEQARGEDLDPRSDLFSLGAVLYELATGDVPFRGATSAVIFAELLGSDPTPPRKLNTKLSAGLDSVIRKLLEKKRENRFASANDLLADLRKLKEGPQAQGRSVPTSAPAATPIAAKPATRISGESSIRDSAHDPAARVIRSRPTSGSRPSAIHSPAMRNSGVRVSMEREAPSSVHPAYLKNEDEKSGGIRWWIPVTAVLLLAGAGGGFFYLKQHSAAGSGVRVVTGGLQITQFDNSTGDNALQEVPAVGLQILMQEMPTLQVAAYAPSLNSADMSAQDMARRSNADAYLTGNVSRDADRYHIHAEIRSTADNSRLAQEDVDASSAVEVPNALSRLAIALRTHLGESAEQATANTVALNTEASNSLNALSLYARGTAYLRAGQFVGAIEQFNKALADDASFVPARLGLVEALRSAGAEPERLQAAALLKPAANKGSACQRYQIAYEMAPSSAASATAAQTWAQNCGLQIESQIALARALLAVGREGEAETAGNRAAELDPAGRTALTVATETMIAQAHYESAGKEQTKAAALGVSSPGLALLAAYLRKDRGAVAQWTTAVTASTSFDDAWYYLTYLGDRGSLSDAMTFGSAAAQRFAAQPAVASSGPLLRARLAAMQAMAGHCKAEALPVADAGDTAKYYAGIADAWCKRPVGTAPQDPGLNAMVRAASLWTGGDADGAMALLKDEKPSSQSPVAALLRGEAHLKGAQQVLAIGDFKAVITRRGEALMTGTIVFPVAQAGLAAAYRTMGDDPNASRAENDLQQLWQEADPSEPLLRVTGK